MNNMENNEVEPEEFTTIFVKEEMNNMERNEDEPEEFTNSFIKEEMNEIENNEVEPEEFTTIFIKEKESTNKSRDKCCFTGCGRTQQKHPKLHFFRFPTIRTNICAQWLINCANETLYSLPTKTLLRKRVCELHFTSDSFTSDMKNYLKKDAVPTIINVSYEQQPSTSSPIIAYFDRLLILNIKNT
ncbi:hypothetical protein LSTR_LSTR004522 [Laodelphax striatellus]|uniref:THAP-type domain-containing protein n=1 Tax=Laodelphax striatellus TaxID=195883 RepID=A0A482XGQ4_LAOST|nr:hypothetical protein LSTR_LSTR004522 [Laodelphax striatellus]